MSLNPWPATKTHCWLLTALHLHSSCHNFHRTILGTKTLPLSPQHLCFVQKSHDFWAFTLLNIASLLQQSLSCTEITRFPSRHVVGYTFLCLSTIISLGWDNDCCPAQRSPDYQANTLLNFLALLQRFLCLLSKHTHCWQLTIPSFITTFMTSTVIALFEQIGSWCKNDED